MAAQAAFKVGEFRHGELRYEGIGNVEAVENYYLERLPLHGWDKDLGGRTWRKGPSRLEVAVTFAPKKGSESFQRIWIDLRMRSERSSPRPQ
ncbi:MAG: hypothetical protein ISR76_06350 [Planctomycetes bacterium]|nr:hypothetical protein [Planctomycetota bacterium]